MTEQIGKAGEKQIGAGSSSTLNLSPNALRVLEKRYLAKNQEGKVIEAPDALFRRVARNIAEADKQYDPNANLGAVEEEFYDLMASLRFLPNSPP
ncbi:MAG: hypothetical protein MPW14_06550 [Candidatus Manganitrophus sp.]|nr:MAG: hypothetical protein MPW14_06550 [Candidatus Manganitrophus sp.]